MEYIIVLLIALAYALNEYFRYTTVVVPQGGVDVLGKILIPGGSPKNLDESQKTKIVRNALLYLGFLAIMFGFSLATMGFLTWLWLMIFSDVFNILSQYAIRNIDFLKKNYQLNVTLAGFFSVWLSFLITGNF